MVFKHNISLAMSQSEDCWMTVQPTRLCTSPLRWETTHTSYGQERTRVGQCIFVPVCEFLFYYVWFLQTFSLCHCPTEHSNNFVECSPLSPSFIKHNNFGGIASQPIASTHLLFPEGDYTHWTFSPTNFPFGSSMCAYDRYRHLWISQHLFTVIMFFFYCRFYPTLTILCLL